MNKSTKKQFAFTLIELLVVIAIIGILSALIVVGMNSTTQKATIAKAQVFANSLRNSLMSDLISEWKLDAKSVSGPPYTTTDTWGTNTGTLMDVDNACSFSGTLKCPQLATNCPSGNCFSFDGIDDYVDLGAGANTDLRNTSFTFSAFIKTSTANSGRIFEWGNIIWKIDTSGKQGFMNPDGAWISLSNTGVADGSWHQVAVTVRRPIDVTYYIDGRADGIIPMTSTTAYTFSGSIFRIGGYNYFVNGSIDDVRLFSAAIPVYQIQQSYFAGLNKLFAKNIINQEDYNNRLAGLNQNTAKN